MNITILGVDPRAYERGHLPAPAPLPHISRRALARVKDRIDPPTACPYCNSAVELVNNSEIYGRSYGEWPFAYSCTSCNAYVGLHKHTDLPLGTMADTYTRDARKAAKQPFLTITRALFKDDRNKAYKWLAQKLDIPINECHFGMMDEDRASKAFTICHDAIFMEC